VRDESTGGRPRRGSGDHERLVVCTLAASAVAVSQLPRSGPNKMVSAGSGEDGKMHALRREADRLALGKGRWAENRRRPLVQMPAGAESRTGHHGPASNQPCPMKKHYRALSAGWTRTSAVLFVNY